MKEPTHWRADAQDVKVISLQ